jgi:hypothetical protein
MSEDPYDLTVIVTAPHSLCRSTEVRDCDRVALEAAGIIVQHFRRMDLAANIHFYPSTIMRREFDLNRVEGAETEWTQKVEADIKQSVKSGKRVVLLDIHSFPDQSADFIGDDRVSPELTLLDVYPSPHMQLLRDIAKTTGFQHIHLFEASRVDYLLFMALRNGARDAMLFEFNENREKISHEQINAMAHVLMVYLENLK